MSIETFDSLKVFITLTRMRDELCELLDEDAISNKFDEFRGMVDSLRLESDG